jgi:hypothetical protein
MKTFNYSVAEYEVDENIQQAARDVIEDYLRNYCIINKPVLAIFSDCIDYDNDVAEPIDCNYILFDSYFNDDVDWGYETIFKKLFNDSDLDEEEVAILWDEVVTSLEDEGILNIYHLSDEYEYCEFIFNESELNNLKENIPTYVYNNALKAFKHNK